MAINLEPWIFYSLLSAVMFSILNVMDKIVIQDLKNPIIPVTFTIIFNAVAGMIIFYLGKVSYLSAHNIVLAFIASILYISMAVCYFKAIKIEEISRVIPFFLITPLFVAILAAIFLGEKFGFLKYMGIFLIVAGSIFISYKGKKIGFGKAAIFMSAGSVFLAIDLVITKYLINSSDFLTVFAYTGIGCLIMIIPVFFMVKKNFIKELKKLKWKTGLIVFSELWSVMASLVFYIAAFFGPLTLVDSLRSIQPLFVLLFATLLSIFYPEVLKEEIGKKHLTLKAIAIILMVIGSYLIIK